MAAAIGAYRPTGELIVSLQFELPESPAVPVVGEAAEFPVLRIFCVGRNYEAHAKEMGFTTDREAPIWFTKSPWALGHSGTTIPYPPGTKDCHYEMEFVVAIGRPAFEVSPASAMEVVFGYACGLDLTRRDLQNAARPKGYPWDTSKDFENAAILSPITPRKRFGEIEGQRISLSLNGGVKQDAALSDMIWSVPELIANLSGMYHLQPGDLIFTGTPAGVGPVAPGDRLEGRIDGLSQLTLSIESAR